MEDSAAPAVVPVAGNEELMAMSEFIRNLDVSLKLFLLLRVDFTLLHKSTTAKSDRKTRTYFSFDLPVRKPTDSESRRK
jgi:cell division protein FtsZ